MSDVVMMCGPSGSGKSTYARGLEGQGYTRLSFDAELWERGFHGPGAPQSLLDEVEAALRARLLAIAEEGHDVVLDFSFSTRKLRDEYRALLATIGVVPRTVYLATDRATLLARVRARGGEHPDDVVLDETTAARHVDDFEVPDPEEGPLEVVGASPPGDSLRA